MWVGFQRKAGGLASGKCPLPGGICLESIEMLSGLWYWPAGSGFHFPISTQPDTIIIPIAVPMIAPIKAWEFSSHRKMYEVFQCAVFRHQWCDRTQLYHLGEFLFHSTGL